MNEEVLKKAVKYLNVRLRSEYEMLKYLQNKGYEREDIAAAIVKLKEYGYIDDLAYAGAFIRDKINFNPCGSKKIYFELRKRGVKTDIINRALAENMCKEVEEELAVKIALKHSAEDKDKLIRYLLGKGFGYSAARKAAEAQERTRMPE